MTLNEIIRIVNEAHPDSLVGLEYWDFEHEKPRDPPGDGDTLALFIVRELKDVYDEDATDFEQLGEAARALAVAQRQLNAVELALRESQELAGIITGPKETT